MGRTDEELRDQLEKLRARDQELARAILGFGVDLNKPRKIDLSFWANDEESAKTFAAACERNEMPPGPLRPPPGIGTEKRWLVTCSIQASVTFVTARDNAATFLLFADKYGCVYDGWGTAIVEAARPAPPTS